MYSIRNSRCLAVLASLLTLAFVATAAAQGQPYPSDNLNRPIRLGGHKAVVFRVQFTDTNPAYELPTALVPQMVADLDAIARANSYDHYWFDFDRFDASGQVSPDGNPWIDLDLPRAESFYSGGNLLVTDVARRFEQKAGFDPSVYDLVAVWAPLNRGSAAVVQYAFMYDIGMVQNPGFVGGIYNDNRAAGTFHEWGHRFGMGHANLYGTALVAPNVFQATGPSTQYGDQFDYMGGVGGNGARFNHMVETIVYPAPLPDPEFVTATAIHANPARKLHHGWLEEANFVRPAAIPGLVQSFDVAPLAAGPLGLKAVEIPRRVTEAGVPESLIVYWRQDEPLSSNGASVAIVSTQNAALASELLQYAPAPEPLVAPTTFTPLQCAFASLGLQSSDVFLDDTGPGRSGAVIRVPSTAGGHANPGNKLRIDVAYPGDAFQFPATSLFNIVSPTIDSRRILGNQDTLQISVEATTEAGVPWHQVDRVEMSLVIGEKPNQITLKLNGAPAQFTFQTGEQTWIVPIANLARDASGAPVRAIVGANAKVFLKNGDHPPRRSVGGGKRFICDQVGPSF